MISKRIGILGGGQLGALLAEATENLDFHPSVMNPTILIQNADEPAAAMPRRLDSKANLQRSCLRAGWDQRDLLGSFFDSVDLVLFENEFVPIDILKTYQSHTEFFPSLATMSVLQNKLFQKQALLRLGIPTSAFEVFVSPNAALDHVAPARSGAYKYAIGGYDGRGVSIVRSPAKASQENGSFHLAHNEFAAFQSFIQAAGPASVYREDLVTIRAELALVSCRFRDGFFHFPLAEVRSAHGLCNEVRGPARHLEELNSHLGLSSQDWDRLELAARSWVEKLANDLKLVGTFAVEFFLNQNNELLVNEIAPRVHNTGHHSLNSFRYSQFDLHVMAACLMNRPDNPALWPFWGMQNVYPPVDWSPTHGPPQNTRHADLTKNKTPFPHSELCWYHKSGARALRKMGHLNVWAKSEAELERHMTQAAEWHSNFWKRQ